MRKDGFKYLVRKEETLNEQFPLRRPFQSFMSAAVGPDGRGLANRINELITGIK